MLFVLQELQAALDAAGAAQIACNPITDNNVAKALARVAGEEGMPLAKEQALAVARQAAGDLRNALEALQLLCTGQQPLPPQPKSRKVRLRVHPSRRCCACTPSCLGARKEPGKEEKERFWAVKAEIRAPKRKVRRPLCCVTASLSGNAAVAHKSYSTSSKSSGGHLCQGATNCC